MIRYRLRCTLAHEFEAWFASSESYEVQAASRQIRCPECGDLDVDKAIMAPNVAVRDRDGPDTPRSSQVTNAGEQLVAAMREVRRTLIAAAVDVGARFPEEARKIHYGETEVRRIRGTATGDEVRELLEEGVSVLALPPLPEDAN